MVYWAERCAVYVEYEVAQVKIRRITKDELTFSFAYTHPNAVAPAPSCHLLSRPTPTESSVDWTYLLITNWWDTNVNVDRKQWWNVCVAVARLIAWSRFTPLNVRTGKNLFDFVEIALIFSCVPDFSCHWFDGLEMFVTTQIAALHH